MFKNLLALSIVPIALVIVFNIYIQDPVFKPFNKAQQFLHSPQTKLSQSVKSTLDPLGNAENKGYFTSDHVQWNGEILENSILANSRLKKYDYYAIYTEKEMYAFVIADIGLTGFSFVSIFDGKEYRGEETILSPLQNIKLSNSTYVGDSKIEGSWAMHFQNLSPTEKHIEIDTWALGGFKADLKLTSQIQQEVVGIIVPFTEHGSQFFHSVKKYNFEVTGDIEIAGKKIHLNKALGVLDWVRATFPYQTTWIWGAGTGYNGKEKFSLNIGEFMGGNQYAVATDDALIVDSKVIKLNTVKVEYDLNDLMKTIKFKTLEGPAAKADISFKPKAQTVNSLNLLLIKQNLAMVYGQFEGIVNDGVNNYKFSIPGQVEFQLARW